MSIRVLLIFLCFSIALGACHNEPYETPSLDLLSLANKGTGGSTSTFTYGGNKVTAFKKTVGSTTISSMRFVFRGDALESIVSDSSVTVTADTVKRKATLTYKITLFQQVGERVVDKTYQYTRDSNYVYNKADTSYTFVDVTYQDTVYVLEREITYDADKNPVKVKATTWSNNIPTEVVVDYTWTNGNATHSFTTTTVNGVSSVRDVLYRYDDQKCIYTKRPEYLFTLDVQEYYWLSNNNPIVVNDGSGEKLNIFWYNKLGYPSNYQDAAGTTYGMAYRQVN